MRGILKTVGIGATALLLVAQLVPIDRTNPSVESDVPAPADVKAVLRAACYDCHSNETRWPWYSTVAPVSWLLRYDVSEGREELNFSTWDRYDRAKQGKKLNETLETLNEGEMPPWYYAIVHHEARLADKDREAVLRWAREGLATASSVAASGDATGSAAD